MNPELIYRKYLNDEFERRRERNLSYSLRAFARDLCVPSSKLSQYLKGSCGISASKASALAAKLNLSPIEAELFVCSAEAAHSRRPSQRNQASEKLRSLLSNTFSEINMEKFEMIRDWYHMAILELTEVEKFQQSPAWIANALGVSEDQVQAAVERLEKLGLLKREPNGWLQTDKNFETPADISSRAIRDYHHQMIRLVDERFEQVPVADRELGSVMFGIDKELVPEFKKLMRRFKKETLALADRSHKKNALYVYNLQFMPIFESKGEV